MKALIKDYLLVLLVMGALALLFLLCIRTRSNTFLFLLSVLILLPNVYAFVFCVPFIPTPLAAVEMILEAAGLKPGDIVYDIGCGDGRIVYLAVKKYGVKGTGFELSPVVYLLAKARQLLWRSQACIKFGNIKQQDLSGADVIFCYLYPQVMRELEPKLMAEMKKGARLISHDYPLPSWKEKTVIDSTAGILPCKFWVYEKE